MSRIAAASVAVALVLGACATRETPYRFRAPVVGGVRAPEPPAAAPRRRRLAAEAPVAPSRRPEPAEPGLAEALRGLVGRRDKKSTHLAFALSALRTIGADLDSEVTGAESGPHLLALARRRGAVDKDVGGALLGDLVVFNRVDRGRPASLVGVAVSRRGDGTVEFVYLARGVVRRGWVNPAKPDDKRDETGRVLNTFVRHNDGGLPRSAPTLAGQLFAGLIRLDRLSGTSLAAAAPLR